jgi:hypothetical protein
MKRSKHNSKRRRKELAKQNIVQPIGTVFESFGSPCNTDPWDGKLPPRDSRSTRRRGKKELRKDYNV